MGKRYSISNTSRVAHNYYRHQFNILINTLRRSLTLQYHIEKQVCVCKKTKVEAKAVVAEANCHLCGHNFKSLQYHIKKQVCVHKNKKAEAKAATQKRINDRKLAASAARERKELERLEAVTEKAKVTAAAAAAGETTTTTKKNQRQENSNGRSKWE